MICRSPFWTWGSETEGAAMRRSMRVVPLVSISALALVAPAFGGVSGATSVPGGGETTAPDGTAASGGGGSIVAFIPTTTNTYIAEWARGAEERAAELGYDLTIIENNFDQAEEDTQVQQQLGAADESLV